MSKPKINPFFAIDFVLNLGFNYIVLSKYFKMCILNRLIYVKRVFLCLLVNHGSILQLNSIVGSLFSWVYNQWEEYHKS